MEIGKDVDFAAYFTPKGTAGPGDRVQSFSVKSIDGESRVITALASSGAIDRDGEIVEPAALKKVMPDYMKNPVILASHTHRLSDGRAPVIGKVVAYRFDRKGLWIDVEFAPTELGQEYFRLYQGRYMRGFSIGFMGLKTDRRNVGGRSVLVHTEIAELYEISACAIPCNPEALSKSKTFIQRKKIDREKERIYNDTDAYTDLIIKAERLEGEHGDMFGNIPPDSEVWKQFSPAEMELLKELEAAAADFAAAMDCEWDYDDEDFTGDANAGSPDDWDEDDRKALREDPAAYFDDFKPGDGQEPDYANYF